MIVHRITVALKRGSVDMPKSVVFKFWTLQHLYLHHQAIVRAKCPDLGSKSGHQLVSQNQRDLFQQYLRNC